MHVSSPGFAIFKLLLGSFGIKSLIFGREMESCKCRFANLIVVSLSYMYFYSPCFISKFTEGKASAVKNYVGKLKTSFSYVLVCIW